jgi:hypothetical protein
MRETRMVMRSDRCGLQHPLPQQRVHLGSAAVVTPLVALVFFR